MKHLLTALLFLSTSLIYSQEKEYLIDTIIAQKNSLMVIPGKTFKKDYLYTNFKALYDSTFNLEELDHAVLMMPFVMSVISVVWQSGKTYWVKKLDKDLAASLEKVRTVFEELHPEISWNGQLKADELVDCTPIKKDDSLGMVFSGGVDSTYSSLMHQHKKQLLITYLGFSEEIASHNWNNVRKQCKEFAQEYGNRLNFFVKSNFRSCIKFGGLQRKHNIESWREFCQEALSLAGLAAPILVQQGCQEFVISSSWDWRFPYAWGSHPFIDNNISFAGVKVKNYDYNTSRQQKLHNISTLCKTCNLTPPTYRVCRGGQKGGNCTLCEKCMRTMNGLVVEGASLPDYGFDTTYEHVYDVTRNQFLNQTTISRFSHAVCHIWQDIQERAQERLKKNEITNESLKAYLEWFASIDFQGQINTKQFSRKLDFEALMFLLP